MTHGNLVRTPAIALSLAVMVFAQARTCAAASPDRLAHVLAGLLPADSRQHALANVASIKAGLGRAAARDPQAAMAYHTLGIQHLVLHEPALAAKDFEAAAALPEVAPSQRLHSLNSEMNSLADAGEYRKAIGLVDAVVAAAKGTPEDSTLSPYALLLGAQWTRHVYAGSSQLEARLATAYRHYVTVSDARGRRWPHWDAQALRGLEHSLQQDGRCTEAAKACDEFVRRFPTDPQTIYIALDGERARLGGQDPPASQLRKLLRRFPLHSSYRCLVLSEYAEALLPTSRKEAELALTEAFAYVPLDSDDEYQPMSVSLAGERLAGLLADDGDRVGANSVWGQLLARFPTDPDVLAQATAQAPDAPVKARTSPSGAAWPIGALVVGLFSMLLMWQLRTK
ncbi:MAG: hypothetical protein ACYC96_00255 [Fimbriimonadaceae bacterium]